MRFRGSIGRPLGIAPIALVLVLAGSPSWALTDEEIFREFRFNLSNPGARSLGLGGAFLSLADDATAAQANPSGLAFLLRSEFFAELRGIDNATQVSLSSAQLPNGIDTGVATGTSFDDSVGVSFLSGVFKQKKWALGFSRQEVVDIRNGTVSGIALGFSGTPDQIIAQGVGSVDLSVVNWNLSAGWRLTNCWSIGGTLTWATLDLQSSVTNTVFDTLGTLTDGVPVLDPVVDLETRIDDSDSDIAYGIGFLYRAKSAAWSVGATYKVRPQFQVEEQVLDSDADGTPGGLDVFGVGAQLGASFTNRLNLPDSVAIGASWTPPFRLTLTAQIERVLYSSLLDDFVSGVSVLTGTDAEFEIDDATDVRGGVEYVFLNRRNFLPKLALRGGGYNEQPGTIRARSAGTSSIATEEALRTIGEDLYQGGASQTHVTLGVGFIFDRFTLDTAADLSDASNEYLLSFIYRLGK